MESLLNITFSVAISTIAPILCIGLLYLTIPKKHKTKKTRLYLVCIIAAIIALATIYSSNTYGPRIDASVPTVQEYVPESREIMETKDIFKSEDKSNIFTDMLEE